MKIAQVYHRGKLKVVVVDEGKIYQVIGAHDIEDIIKEGFYSLKWKYLVDESEVIWAPPVIRPSKIIAIGLNYSDHIHESKGNIPKNPIIFAKYPSSLLGHKGYITWDHRKTCKVDFEAELAIVIGKMAKDVSVDEAREVIFGYTCANDVSARDLQFGDGQWTRGKSLDTFCPVGPWIVTKDEISDPQDLEIRSILNGVVMQSSNTSRMIFGVYELVSFLSQYMTLMPMDLILTGTPSGVGAFREPPVYMKEGDEIVVSVTRIGELVNYCKVMGQ